MNTLCSWYPSSFSFFFFLKPSYIVISQRAEAKLANVESSLQELNALSNAVAEYFCEDPATFKLEECCSIFHSFCKRFDAAVKVWIDRIILLLCIVISLHLVASYFNICIFSSHGYRRTGSERQQSIGASGRRACVFQLNAAPQCPAQDLSLIRNPPAWNRSCTAFSPVFQRD